MRFTIGGDTWDVRDVEVDDLPAGLVAQITRYGSEDEGMGIDAGQVLELGGGDGIVGYVVTFSFPYGREDVVMSWYEHTAPCIRGKRVVSCHERTRAALEALREQIDVSVFHKSVCETCRPVMLAKWEASQRAAAAVS